MAATEDGLLETEQWETLELGPGQSPSPLTELEWDRDSGKVRRKEGFEEVLITIHPPERPY